MGRLELSLSHIKGVLFIFQAFFNLLYICLSSQLDLRKCLPNYFNERKERIYRLQDHDDVCSLYQLYFGIPVKNHPMKKKLYIIIYQRCQTGGFEAR